MMRSPIIFGWAKPVPINFFNLRNPKSDMVWVGLAGPAANFALALTLAILIKFQIFTFYPLQFLLVAIIFVNLALAVFNLVPVPPLDGSRILTGILPRKYASRYSRLEPYGFIILIILLYLGLIDKLILPIVGFMAKVLGTQVLW
jgi:Zn-dependent protease